MQGGIYTTAGISQSDDVKYCVSGVWSQGIEPFSINECGQDVN